MKHSYGAALCTPGCGHLFLNMYIVIVTVHAEDFYGTGLGLILNFYFSQIYMTIFFNKVLVIAHVLPFGHPLRCTTGSIRLNSASLLSVIWWCFSDGGFPQMLCS